MIYNTNNELIEVDFGEKFEQNLNGKKTFSISLQVPEDEYLARIRIEIRFTDNSATIR